jgi:hypothetical protein
MDICQTLYISPQPLFERLKLERFVGRTWLIHELDTFLATNECGYFILEAEAGLGKSSFLAHLVNERSYIHLFVEQARGLDNLADGLRTLATQIIRTWKLQSWFSDDVLHGMAVRPDFLHRLLYVAAGQRNDYEPDTPIVLVIDGLEAAGTLPGQNIMGLPQELPRGVYIVTARRPGAFLLDIQSPKHLVSMHPTTPQHLDDMRQFLANLATTPPIRQVVEASTHGPDTFVTTLIQKSNGVWSYLFYVIEDLERAAQENLQESILLLNHLPDGLWSYYARYWKRQRDLDTTRWEQVFLPLISTLCAIFEPVSASMLCVLAGVDLSKDILKSLLHEQWSMFVTTEGQKDARYCIYDTTMRDFFNGCVNCEGLNMEDQALTRELIDATLKAHERIAHIFLEGWGDLHHGLPRLANPDIKNIVVNQPASNKVIDATFLGLPPLIHTSDSNQYGIVESGYGLRHLVAHLEQAGRSTEIHQLLRVERTIKEHQPESSTDLFHWIEHIVRGWLHDVPTHHALVWHIARERQGDLADFLSDVAQAWQLVETQVDTRLPLKDPLAEDIPALQVRYGLIIASIHSLAHHIPLPLLVALLEKQVWTPSQVLVYIREMADEEHRASALVAIAPYMPDSLLESTLAIAQALGQEQERCQTLVGLAPFLPAALRPRALFAARSIEYPALRATALIGLVPYLAGAEKHEVCAEILNIIHTVWHTNIRTDLLVDLAPHLPETLLREALESVREIRDESWRYQAFIELAPYLPPPLQRETLSLWEAWDASLQARLFSRLGLLLHQWGDIEKAFSRACSLGNEPERATALAGLAPYLSEPQLNDAIDNVRAMSNEQAQSKALAGLAGSLPRILVREALNLARGMHDVRTRVETIIILMPTLDEEEHGTLVSEMLDTIHTIGNKHIQAIEVSNLAYRLAKGGFLEEAFDVIQTIDSKREKTRALTDLAPYLSDSLLNGVLGEVRTIKHSHQRLQALAKLAPYLPVELLQPALDAARAIGDTSYQGHMLVDIAPYLPDSFLQHILQLVKMVGSERDQADLLVGLAPHMPESLLKEALELTRTIEREDYRRTALVGLSLHIPDSLVSRVLDVALAIEDEHERALALKDLIPLLPTLLLRKVLDNVRTFHHEHERAHVLVTLVPRLSDSSLQRVLTEVRKLKEQPARMMVITVLAPALARQGYWRQAHEEAWNIAATEDRAITLAKLMPYMPPILVHEVTSAVRAIQHPDVRARVLAELRLHVPPEEQIYLVDEILRAALAARWRGAASPSEIVPFIKEPEIIDRIFESVQMIDTPDDRVLALVDLAYYLPEPQHHDALHRALIATRMMWGQYRAEALADLGPHLPENLLPEAVSDARSLEREECRAIALTGLIPHLSPSLRGDVLHDPLATAQKLWNINEQVHALGALLPYVAQDERAQILRDLVKRVVAIEQAERRFEVLRILAPHLAQLPLELLYPLWCHTLHQVSTRSRRDMLLDLRALIPVLLAISHEQVMVEIAQAVIDVGRWFE